MSKETQETLNVTKSERTSRIQIDTERGKPWTVKATQEIAHTKDGSAVPFSRVSAPDITRTVADANGNLTGAGNENVTLADSTVITVAQIMEACEKLIDRWREEDQA